MNPNATANATPGQAPLVRFRDDFSPVLVGMVFEAVELHQPGWGSTGREVLVLRRRIGKRWNYRTAWVNDLIAV